MRDVDPAVADALAVSDIVKRTLISISTKDRSTGEVHWLYLHDDVGTLTFGVIDPVTGATAYHDYVGGEHLLSVSEIVLTQGLDIRDVTISLNKNSPLIQQYVRGYDPRLGALYVHYAFFDKDTRELVAPPICWFLGFEDTIPIQGGAVGGESKIDIKYVSHTREATITSTAKRSAAHLRARAPDDAFMDDASTVADWEMFWGTKSGKVATAKAKSSWDVLGLFT